MRLRKILIHLGAHRTGTTFLQTTFAQTRQALADRNIRYLSFRHFPGYRRAFLRARYALRDGDLETYEKEFATVAKLLSDELARHPEMDFLLSYEGFLGDLSQRRGHLYPLHAILLEKLLKVFDAEQVHAAFSIREYGAFVESGYKYLAQTGLKDNFRRYVARLDREGITWVPIVRSLKAACGDEVSLWAYDDFARSPEALIDWLFDRVFGVKADFLQLPDERRNISVSRAALPALLLYNRVVRLPRKSSNNVYNLLLKCLPASRFGYPALFDKPTKEALRQRYVEDVATIRAEVPDFYSAPVAG